MTLATLDTNILASGFVQEHGATAPVQLLDAWLAGAFTLLLSQHVLEELQRTFLKPYFARRLPVQQQADTLAILRTLARITPLTVPVHGVATHPEDDLVLATALSGEAQFLVTGDYKLLRLKRYQGVLLVSAREFLAMLPGLGGDQGD